MLRIVVIGSSSTVGLGATSLQNGYVSVLQSRLQTRKDLAVFQVVNKGVSGDTLAQIDARLQRDVFDQNPQLVVLQTGTNDATKQPTATGASEFGTHFRSVLAKIRERSPVVIVNGQYYPFGPLNYSLYMSTMEQTATEQDVPLLDRYGLMRNQVESGRYSFSDLIAPDGLHPSNFSHNCLGTILSDLIIQTLEQGS